VTARLASVALLVSIAAPPVAASDTDDLVALINAFRAAPQTCDGARTVPAPPLVPNVQLAEVRVDTGTRLLDALKARGYLASSTQYIHVSGPTEASQAMRFMEPKYCAPLTSAQFNDIGVIKNGTVWQIILARRQLSSNLGDWQAAGMEVLRLTNAARAAPRTCGGRHYGAALPLSWNTKLAAAALAHSRDMAANNYLDHVAPNGSRADTRATKQGYSWARIGENIAGGQGSPEQVVAGWIASPDHCVNVMDPKFTEMGAAYVVNPKGDKTIYWTQVFGSTR
jgi:uncharacterized protein YkwD